jgi:integrase
MARNREKIGSLTRQVQTTLDSKLAIGQSKHLDKMKGDTQGKIYSWETYRSYMKHNNYFVAYCKEQYARKTLEECRPHVDEWLKNRSEKGLSAYTQKLEASALAKMYGCSTKDFIKTDTRNRADITRSRGEKVRDYHFSEYRHKDLVEFCKSTGLRRSELQALTGDKLIEKDGQYYIKVDKGSKGGRYREAPVIRNVNAVVERMRSVGTGKVFEKVANGADIHSYRSNYCTAIYNAHARDPREIDRSERFCCRGDLKGTWYDKKAMLVASQALGHNRISVIAEHYIRG